MTTHLEALSDVLCGHGGVHPRSTDRLCDVDCLHCLRRLALIHRAEENAAADRRIARKHREAAERVGLGPVLDHIDAQHDDDSASLRMVRELFGSLAVWLVESGYRIDRDQQAAA